MDSSEIKKILKISTAFNLKSIKIDGEKFEAEFHERAPGQQMPGILTETEERMPSDDEMMQWSSPSFDLIRAEREAALKPPQGN